MPSRSPTPSPKTPSTPIVQTFVVGIIVLLYIDLFWGGSTKIECTRKGLLAIAVSVCLFGLSKLDFRTLNWPHPMFWRLLHCVGMLYFAGLLWLLMQEKSMGRTHLQVFDQDLGLQPPEENTKEYAVDCRIVDGSGFPSKVVTDTINDVFLLSHTIGWFGLAIVTRSYWMCWIMSVEFEILEMSFQDMMTNFQECWWDHIFLDILGGNALGIFLGMQCVSYFGMEHYDWLHAKKVKTISKTSTSASMTSYFPCEWDIFSDPRRFFCVVFIMHLLNGVQIMVFFLKFALWLPPPHPLTWGRTMFWVVLAIPAVNEFYRFTMDSRTTWNKLGPNAWLAIALSILELGVSVKYGMGEYEQKSGIPPRVYNAWTGCLIMLALWASAYFYNFWGLIVPYARMQPGRRIILDNLFLAIALPLMALFMKECCRTFQG